MIWTSESHMTKSERRQEKELLYTQRAPAMLSPVRWCWPTRKRSGPCFLLHFCLRLREMPAQQETPSTSLCDQPPRSTSHTAPGDSVHLDRVAEHLERAPGDHPWPLQQETAPVFVCAGEILPWSSDIGALSPLRSITPMEGRQPLSLLGMLTSRTVSGPAQRALPELASPSGVCGALPFLAPGAEREFQTSLPPCSSEIQERPTKWCTLHGSSPRAPVDHGPHLCTPCPPPVQPGP